MAGLAWLNAVWCNVIQRMVFRKISTEQSMSATDTQLFINQLKECDEMVKEALGIKKEEKPIEKKITKVDFPDTWQCHNCQTTNNAKRTHCVNSNCQYMREDVKIEDEKEAQEEEEAPKNKSCSCFKCFKKSNQQPSEDIEETEENRAWRLHAEEEKQMLEMEMQKTKDIRRMTVS